MIELDDIKESNYSIIGKDCHIQGNITLVGNTHIYSKVDGDIIHTDDSVLVLEYSSIITGNITATDVVIIGTFKGKLVASGKVIIQPTAKVSGELECHNLVVQPGAFLEIQASAEAPTSN